MPLFPACVPRSVSAVAQTNSTIWAIVICLSEIHLIILLFLDCLNEKEIHLEKSHPVDGIILYWLWKHTDICYDIFDYSHISIHLSPVTPKAGIIISIHVISDNRLSIV